MSVTIKSAREIELIREACRIIGIIHQELGKELKPGMSTHRVDQLAEEMIRSYGCVPNFKGYGGCPASVCVSINEEVVHGIPSKERIIQEGDIVSLDMGVHLSRISFRCGKDPWHRRNFKRSAAFDRSHAAEFF